ncbi:MAG: T9SS type A sorting domain-containing protein [Saprospiraceae bacterium]|nr:T9SS type A sorting domain-containing protein [Saprospiraceae bacterium]
MIYIRLFVACLALAALYPALDAQYLLSAEMIGQLSKSQIEAQFGYEVRTGVTMYKARYMTTGTQGQPDTASGLIVIPDEFVVEEIPVVAYQHGTTNGPESVPSQLSGGHDLPIAFGAMGYVASATDYLGLGDSKGFHPYVHAATEASAGLDMLIATTEFLEDETGQPWLGPLFVSGYSQGGHGAAALQRELEQNWGFVFPVTASAPMSGPYDMSGIMFDRITSDAIYFFPAYIAYVTLGYQEIYGDLYDEVSDLFKAPYVATIEQFYNAEITLFELNTFMINRLFVDNLLVQPIKMLRDSVVEILRNDTLDHPIKDALADNDLYNWTPQVPTRLLYCMADEQVPFQNSLVADSTMNANGAPDVKSIDIDSSQDHAGCAPLAFLEAVEFFDSFILTSDTRDLKASPPDLSIYPVPADRHLVVDPGTTDVLAVGISDLAGRQVMQTTVTGRATLNVADIPPGIYLLTASHGTDRFVRKIVID